MADEAQSPPHECPHEGHVIAESFFEDGLLAYRVTCYKGGIEKRIDKAMSGRGRGIIVSDPWWDARAFLNRLLG